MIVVSPVEGVVAGGVVAGGLVLEGAVFSAVARVPSVGLLVVPVVFVGVISPPATALSFLPPQDARDSAITSARVNAIIFYNVFPST